MDECYLPPKKVPLKKENMRRIFLEEVNVLQTLRIFLLFCPISFILMSTFSSRISFLLTHRILHLLVQTKVVHDVRSNILVTREFRNALKKWKELSKLVV